MKLYLYCLIRFFYLLKKIYLRFFHFVFPFPSLGVHAIVINKNQQVLLIKQTYNKYWTLPGGGVKKRETIMDALFRELKEEVGVEPEDEPHFLGVYSNHAHGGNDYPLVYVVSQYRQFPCKSLEIDCATWFSFEELPQDISPGVLRRLNEYFHSIKPSVYW